MENNVLIKFQAKSKIIEKTNYHVQHLILKENDVKMLWIIYVDSLGSIIQNHFV